MSNIPIQHRLKVASAPVRLALKQHACETRVAIPGIIVANPQGNPFDPVKQTVSVQPAIQESMLVNGTPTLVNLPILDDVPFQMPTAGGWALTMPPAVGDECLVVFSDMAFDHWWESGGVQKQPDGKLYRHDIGDGMAILGISSVPRVLPNFSTTSAQLRSRDGSVVVDLSPGELSLFAAVVNAAASETGTPQPVVTQAWLTWFTAYVLPHITLPPGTPPPPVTSITTILLAE